MRILGLDLGTNSIGWASIDTDDPNAEVLMGVRIFSSPVNPKNQVPLNANRRAKRMQRKILARRRMRKSALKELLTQVGLLPKTEDESDKLFDDHLQNPYVLRRKALDQAVTNWELGRAIFHLSLRRGYKSNRKAQLSTLIDDPDILAIIAEEEEGKLKREGEEKSQTQKERDKEEGQVLKAIGELQQSMKESGARTVGEYQAMMLEHGNKARRGSGQVANSTREMIEDEFEQIWSTQAKNNPKLTDALKAKIFQIIFFQRPLKIQRFLVENCPFESNRKRAMKAHLTSHRFRILQTVNNLKWRTAGMKDAVRLTAEQSRLLVEKLHDTQKVSWATVRKTVGNKDAIFNFEEAGEDNLVGNKTHLRLKSALGEKWGAMQFEAQEQLVHEMLTSTNPSSFIKRLRGYWELSAKEAYVIATTELERGTASISVKAMRKLIPFMVKGHMYHEACQEVGYKRKDQLEIEALEQLPPPPDARNPVVNRTMNELRRLINAYIKAYGKPDIIRIEMAREMKLTKMQKEKVLKQQSDNRKLNEIARTKLKELDAFGSISPTRNDLEKYRLWCESDEQCPYTGKTIPIATLFSQDWDVEHIIPYPLSLDNTFGNKTLCFATENRDRKKKQTPQQAYDGTNQYDKILQRVDKYEKMSPGKRNLFRLVWSEEQGERFLRRQLVDTAYATRLATEFLANLGVPVEPTKGGMTAPLREHWGLNTILSEDGKKNRDDHRHHAIDALVVALTSKSLMQALSKLSGQHGSYSLNDSRFHLPSPIPDLRKAVVPIVEKIIVSHQTTRKIAGALHEETAYGRVGSGIYAYRKRIVSLTDAEVKRIRDPKVRERIQQFTADERKKLPAERPITWTDRYGSERFAVTVRLTANKKDDTMTRVAKGSDHAYKFHPKGSNHRAVIFEKPDGTLDAQVISTIDALALAHGRKPEGFEMRWMALPNSRQIEIHINDIVQTNNLPSPLYRIVNFSPKNPIYLIMRELSQATESESKLAPSSAKRRTDVLIQSSDGLACLECRCEIDVLGRFVT